MASVSYKLMKVNLLRLNYYLDSNDLLLSPQYHFEKGHNTTDQALYFIQCIRDAQYMKHKDHSIAAFLDLS